MSANTIPLTTDRDGVLLPVRAQPGARRTGVVGVHAGRLKLAVSAPPEKGKANEALIEAVKNAFGLRKSQVALISGQASNQKLFRLSGTTVEVIRERLVELLSTTKIT
jgi:uncharacterized protein